MTAPVARAGGIYDLTDLGELKALAINDLGDVVGSDGLGNAFLMKRRPEGGFDYHDLGAGQAVDINNSGQILLRFDNDQGALLDWDTGSTTALDFNPTAVNDLGVVVGTAKGPSSSRLGDRAFVHANGVTEEFTDLLTDISYRAWLVPLDINNRGDIVGSIGGSWVGDPGVPLVEAFVLNGSRLEITQWNEWKAVNEQGDLVGEAWMSDIRPDHVSGVLYGQPFEVFGTDLEIEPGVFGYVFTSSAVGINESGQVLGNLHLLFNQIQPYDAAGILGDAGEWVLLNKLIDPVIAEFWQLEKATGLNDLGQIIGHSDGASGNRSWLLTPIVEDIPPAIVPEPSALALMLVAAPAGALCLRRRARVRRDGLAA